MVSITINNHKIEIPEGSTILDAARSAGIEIPTLCHHKDLSIAGNCRICQVEWINSGRPEPFMVASCHTEVQEGMIIDTNSSATQRARKTVMEFIFLNHPIDCPVCDQAGECILHENYLKYATYNRRANITPVKKTKMKKIGNYVMLDSERCILCTRCIRFTEEITKTSELALFKRGNETELNIVDSNPLNNPYSLCTVDLCPVGALTSIPFRFKKRVWFLKKTPSICTGCARGCNIYLEHDDQNKIYRITPRENQAVNGNWLCDRGRLNYITPQKQLIKPHHRQQKVTPDHALDQIIQLIKDHQKISVVISAHTLFESAFLIRYFCYEYLDITQFYIANTPDQPGDDLLMSSDQNPNRRGVTLALGKHLQNKPLTEAFQPGELVLFFGGERCNDMDQIIQKTEQSTLVLFTRLDNELSDVATVALPIQPYIYQDGFMINCDYRLQHTTPLPKISPRFVPSPEGIAVSKESISPPSIQELIKKIARKMGFALKIEDRIDLLKLMKQEYPLFQKIDYTTFPPGGIPLEPQEEL